ncbi:MAG: DUF1858 domain-containing protein [Candidatus Delongbacteria bacterium]|nr:DUF1858 domain-containing protein [Candidatus Delongbacteria bacterium]
MEIQQTTKLFALFAEYPELEEKVMQMAPVFRNLKNPVLRRTVGKLATVEKVALIGKLDPGTFLNTLRREAGLPPVEELPEMEVITPSDAPTWAAGEPIQVVNGTAMLETGVHPLGLINQLLQEAVPGEFILLQTNFAPLPLIEAMEKQEYQVFHAEDAGEHLTYVRKG